ncbi:hypothetical protein [Mangrovibacterium diazotrophicum]|uniref:hypothetical protein n=1 Tax=Mangrovibacterium diazotrophicum TaxID=1261403 RepID=UPI000E75D344|nr:hypothetical protein [Mangrovibacterium diazotrophicum]
MKKRDYYILAILACLVVYAALHRKSFAEEGANKINNLLKQNASTEAMSSPTDSLISRSMDVRKGEI